jgi:hypothetical protein
MLRSAPNVNKRPWVVEVLDTVDRRRGSSPYCPIEIADSDNDDDDGPLSQLVDQDTDAATNVTLTSEQERVILSMTKMRSNLERYVQQEVCKIRRKASRKTRRRNSGTLNDANPQNLFRSIKALQATGRYDVHFVDTMHTLRDYGNAAVHARYLDLPSYKQCTDAVKKYLKYKQLHKLQYG